MTPPACAGSRSSATSRPRARKPRRRAAGAKHGIVSRTDHLSAFSEVEQAYSARKPLQAGRRLSCTAKILGDVVIDVPAESQAHRQIVRKAAEAVAIELDPA